MALPQLSVVVPVYNEAAGLPALFERLYALFVALFQLLNFLAYLRKFRFLRPRGMRERQYDRRGDQL